MKQIGLFEAKTNLSRIVETVRRTGQPVTLTRRGEPYADLVPHRPQGSRRSKRQVLDDLDRLRKQLPKITAAEIRQAIEEGRR